MASYQECHIGTVQQLVRQTDFGRSDISYGCSYTERVLQTRFAAKYPLRSPVTEDELYDDTVKAVTAVSWKYGVPPDDLVEAVMQSVGSVRAVRLEDFWRSTVLRVAGQLAAERPPLNKTAIATELSLCTRRLELLRRRMSEKEAVDALLREGAIKVDLAYRLAAVAGLTDWLVRLLPAFAWWTKVDNQRHKFLTTIGNSSNAKKHNAAGQTNTTDSLRTQP